MKKFWRYIEQQTWFIAAPLLLLSAYGSSALAAQTPSFSATTSGTTNNLSVTANLNVSDTDAGKDGNNYLGFNINQTWYFHNGIGWTLFNSGAVPVYVAAPLANRAIEVVRNQDLSGMVGAQLYVGYGLTEGDMVANGKYAMIYTVTDTTAPTVTGTIHTNGATNVAINTKVGVAFSEAMNATTITSATFTLKETASGNAVTGTVSYTGVSAIFIPSGNLAGNTGYTVTVKGGASGVKDLAGNPMTSDFSISWITGAATDTTAPTVTGAIHTNGATNVAINTKVGATFSEGMDPLTITSANFTLKETVSGNAVAGAVSYSGVSAVFTPSGNLAANTRYTVTVKGGTSGVKDLAGNPMTGDISISWTTVAAANTTAPTVTGTIHANGATNVAINSSVGATFSEGMDPLTITNVNFTLKETVSGTAVAGIVSYSGVSATFIPLSNLTSNTGYTITVKGGAGGVKDLTGNPMASDFSISWTTGVTTDTTAPTVIGASNVNGATNVAIDTPVKAIFSEWMDPLTITNVTFTLKETATGTAIAGIVNYANGNVEFVLPNPLADNTIYTATIKGGSGGAKDLAGNTLASDYTWSWTTGTTSVLTDTSPPTVDRSVIANGATGVPIGATIGATFSEAMNPATINTTTVTLMQGTTPISGAVSYSVGSVAFAPSNPLSFNTTYTATIKGGIGGVKDLAGNALVNDYVWSWTTGTM